LIYITKYYLYIRHYYLAKSLIIEVCIWCSMYDVYPIASVTNLVSSQDALKQSRKDNQTASTENGKLIRTYLK
jgi:hypothetical protein